MTGVVRVARHEPDILLVEYKQMQALTLKQVKSLRSQVSQLDQQSKLEFSSNFQSFDYII